MTFSRLIVYALLTLATVLGCAKHLPDEGPLAGTFKSLSVSGAYKRVALDSVERISIDNGKLVIHGTSAEVPVDMPANADPNQRNRGWALVTESEDGDRRSLTFTQETSLEDFSINVPNSAGQVAYGSLAAKDGGDVLLFAYGSGSKCYWGWAVVTKNK